MSVPNTEKVEVAALAAALELSQPHRGTNLPADLDAFKKAYAAVVQAVVNGRKISPEES